MSGGEPKNSQESAFLDLTVLEMQEFLLRVEPGAVVKDRDYEIIRALVETVRNVHGQLGQKNASIARLKALLFGPRTEKRRNVLPEKEGGVSDSSSEPDAAADSKRKKKRKKPRKGHGRNGAEAYTDAERIRVDHTELEVGQTCPDCESGKLNRLPDRSKTVRVVGQPCLKATVWEGERFRCGACGDVFHAELPPEAKGPKYDETAGSIIAMLRYGSGFPNHRLERLQKDLGIPVPATVQYEVASGVAETLGPVFEQLLHEAAQADVTHNDDTSMKILDDKTVMVGKTGAKRTGTFTTSIVAKRQDAEIVLFFTGRQHAGENLLDLLKRRLPERGPPIQMCDALNRNYPDQLQTMLSNCLAHGRRKFVEVAGSFPAECERVLDDLATVYRNDADTRRQDLSDEERLTYHQEHSGPVLKELRAWFQDLFNQKKVEPNSTLGQPIRYMLEHWHKLTLFLEIPGVPLDNNVCERMLKMAILHRKNSLFYKTNTGAAVGDLLMSVIQTCRVNKVNPFHYLTELQRNASSMRENPERWLPWNYQDALPATATA